jgi:20S proteasome alpha/beta subunit
MTTAIGLICGDGLVIGTDTKVTYGYGMKKPGTKLFRYDTLGKRSIVLAGAGATRHGADAVAALELDRLEELIGSTPTFDNFLDRVLEVQLPRFSSDYQAKYNERPSFGLIIGCVEKHPRLVQAYNDGDYDYEDDFATIGTGAIFGEILLRKLYTKDLTVELGKKIVAYAIWEVQNVDNNSGEGMEIIVIGKDGIAEQIGPEEVEKYKVLPDAMNGAYVELRKKLESWN